MVYYEDSYLMHHGIKGQKWRTRRWQNSDGTFNEAGKARYFGANSDHRPDSVKEAKQKYKAARKEYNKAFNNAYNHNHPYSFSKKRREASNARWEEAGAKAEALNKAQKEYKVAKGNVKLEKTISRVEKARDKTLSAREKNMAKLSDRMDKRVASGRSTQLYSDYRKKDFDLGTKMVKSGYDRYAKTIKDYKSMKISAINDPSIKKSDVYKEAGRAYRKQLFSDAYYGGMPMTVLMYAGQAASELEDR